MSPRDLEALLVRQLKSAKCLFVFDDCDAVPAKWLNSLLTRLMTDTHRVHVLATARAPLGGVPGQCTHRLQPLSVYQGSVLLGKLLGKATARACAITLDRAKAIVVSVDGNPERIIQAAAKISTASGEGKDWRDALLDGGPSTAAPAAPHT